MKKCTKCKLHKEESEFYSKPGSSTGLSSICKSCQKESSRLSKAKNINECRRRDRGRNKSGDRKRMIEERRKSPSGVISAREASRRYYHKNKKVKAAHTAVRLAIESGEMLRVLQCERCGSERMVEAHHDDYDSPLDVRWLCRVCHKGWHIDNKAAGK